MSSTTDAGVTTTYTYDGDGNRLSSSNGTTTTSYAWDTNWALPELASESQGGSELRGYTYGTRVLSMLEGGASYYFHTDRLGSIAAVTSASGQTESQYSYDPFGNLRTSSQAAGAPANPLGFVGQLQDQATGLYDMRARMYDPSLGRFTATDPEPGGATVPAIEAYDYTGQDPIDGTDLGGTICWRCFKNTLRDDAKVAAPVFAGFVVGGVAAAVTLNPAIGVAAGAAAAGATSYAVSRYADHDSVRVAVKNGLRDATLSGAGDLVRMGLDARAVKNGVRAVSLSMRVRGASYATAGILRLSSAAVRIHSR